MNRARRQSGGAPAGRAGARQSEEGSTRDAKAQNGQTERSHQMSHDLPKTPQRGDSSPPAANKTKKGELVQPERGAPQDVVLGDLDLLEPEQLESLDQDDGAAHDRGGPIGMQAADLPSLGHGQAG